MSSWKLKQPLLPHGYSETANRSCSVIETVLKNFAKFTGKHLCRIHINDVFLVFLLLTLNDVFLVFLLLTLNRFQIVLVLLLFFLNVGCNAVSWSSFCFSLCLFLEHWTYTTFLLTTSARVASVKLRLFFPEAVA